MLRKNISKVVSCYWDPYISELLFITVTRLSHSFFGIVKRSSIHRFQLVFVIFFIAPIGLICFTTLNAIHFVRSVRDVVYLNCCSRWAENESFFLICEKTLEIVEMTVHYFIECLMSVTYINSSMHRAFYSINLKIQDLPS